MMHHPLKIIIEQTSDGFSAYADQLNIFSVGNNIDDVKINMLEAVNLFLEEEKKGRMFNIHDLEFISTYIQLA